MVKDKVWSKPCLVVLTRGNQVEAVLTTCKGNSTPIGANTEYNGCHLDGPCHNPCEEIASS